MQSRVSAGPGRFPVAWPIAELAAGLAAGIPVDLRDTVTGLDNDNAARLLRRMRRSPPEQLALGDCGRAYATNCFDEARALAIKAIWSLGRISGEAARRALTSIAASPCSILAEAAVAQLQR